MIRINRFVKDVKKYFQYALYSAKCELKAEVANSYLNWLWWILEPICMMFVYIFVVEVVFKSKEPNFPVFVFIGITIWNFFNKMVLTSVKLIKTKKSIISKVYLPKHILVLENSFIYSFKALISFVLILILMILFKIKYSLYLLLFVPYFILFYIFTFGISCVLMHFGTYVEDLNNVTNIALKFLFYFSGVFYNIEKRLPNKISSIILNLNPIALIIDGFRKILLYSQMANIFILFFWFIIGLIICYIGIKLIYKYEKSYIKVI